MTRMTKMRRMRMTRTGKVHGITETSVSAD